MLRRCIFDLSRRRSLPRVPTQNSYLLSSRKEFSASSRQNPSKSYSSLGKAPDSKPSGSGKIPESGAKSPESGGSNFPKLVVGGVLISGVVAAAAYQSIYLDPPKSKEESTYTNASNKTERDIGGSGEEVIVNNQEPSASKDDVLHVVESGEAHLDNSHISDKSKVEDESQVQGGFSVTPEEDASNVQQNDLPSFSQDGISSNDQVTPSKTMPEDIIDEKEVGNDFTDEQKSIDKIEVGNGFTEEQSSMLQNEVVNAAPSSQETEVISEETEVKTPAAHDLTPPDVPEDSLVNDAEPPTSLVDVYHLGEKNGQSDAVSPDGQIDGSIPHSKEREGSVGTSEELKDGYTSKDGNLVLDFLEAIHAAEKRQAELDAHILAKETRNLKEIYEKELKDARARELMIAKEAAMLDRELNKERILAAATVKSLQEKAEENLKMELERKDNEAEMQLKKVKELAQAELAATIVSEKASQIEKMAEANLHINALCMAFYARSEEARQSHSVHKLALGALALEDALSKGLPIQSEIRTLHTYLEGIDKDSLLNLVLSSFPEETLNHGTETLLQLNQQFDSLKTALRHYSLIPPGGGGILAHTVAHIASGLKVKEKDVSGDGIESIINRVERFLAEGKLAEAADALEGGVSGSQADQIVSEWAKRARNRAITEQALSLLQSYATSISVT